MSDAEWLEFQKLAAQMARACEIISAADKLAEEAARATRGASYNAAIEAALDAYKVVRQGT